MPRLTKIYTRKGDEGYTQLGDKAVSKDDLLIEALGTIDELNSQIGLILAMGVADKEIVSALTRIQHDLFDLGGEMHLPQYVAITPEKITQLEQWLDGWNQTLPTLEEFILPRGNPPTAACHVARTVCRRAERCMVRLHRQVALHNPHIIRYLNRLSDLLFVLCRVLNREGGEKETMWDHKKKR